MQHLSIAHSRLNDATRHVSRCQHSQRAAAISKHEQIIDIFPNERDHQEIIKAEVLFIIFIVEHNLPLSVNNHAGPLFRSMFPDSKIAKKYGCARTKTGNIMRAMADEILETLTDLAGSPYCLSTDGSKDERDKKLFPSIIKFFSEKSGHVVLRLVGIPTCSKGTSDNIFNIVTQDLEGKGISINQCVVYSSDNTSVMVGRDTILYCHCYKRSVLVY